MGLTEVVSSGGRRFFGSIGGIDCDGLYDHWSVNERQDMLVVIF